MASQVNNAIQHCCRQIRHPWLIGYMLAEREKKKKQPSHRQAAAANQPDQSISGVVIDARLAALVMNVCPYKSRQSA